VPLKQDLPLIPLPDETLADLRLSEDGPFYILDGQGPLPEQLADVLRDVSAEGVVAYVEAEFFGGQGSQASMVFERGSLVFSPVVASTPFRDGAFNQALRHFGVTVEPGAPDEFASVGLGRRRLTRDWLK
jgi:hypothetical protein